MSNRQHQIILDFLDVLDEFSFQTVFNFNNKVLPASLVKLDFKLFSSCLLCEFVIQLLNIMKFNKFVQTVFYET